MDLSVLLTEIKAANHHRMLMTLLKYDIAHSTASVTAVYGTIVYLVGATMEAKDTSRKLVATQKVAYKSGG